MDVIQEIINLFQKELETNYFELCTKCESDVVSFNSYSVNFCNERTIGHFCEDFIQNNFSTFKLIPISLLNEFSIKMDPSTAKSLPDFSSEVSEAKDSKGIYYSPDSCFLVDDKIIYIEYKVMKSSFSYIKLARDYLKFKHYSHNSKKESWFVYVYLSENTSLKPVVPTILLPGKTEPKYQYISKIVSRSSIDKTARVFIYRPEIGKDKEDDTPIDSPLLPDNLLGNLDSILDNCSNFDVADSNGIFNQSKQLSRNVFYVNRGAYGSKVATSYQIRQKYFEIKELFDWFVKNHKSLVLTSQKTINFDSDFLADIDSNDFKESSLYFSNQIKKLNEDKKNAINGLTFNVTYRRSLWIILLFKKFAEDNNLSYFSNIKFEDEKDNKDFQAIWDDLKERYKDQFKHRFDSLCFELMVLIVNSIPFIYKIENDKVTNDYSDEFKASLNKENLLRCYKDITKLLNIEDFDISKDFDTDELNKEILSKIINL